eukprot:gene20998-23050_t
MASLIEKHEKLMKLAKITFDELVGIAGDAEKEDIEIGYEQTGITRIGYVDGYEEAKRILVSACGKDSKVHKALIKEIENLHQITNIHKTASVHEFYNKLSRTVRTLATLKKLDSAQSTVYTLLDKLGPVREILAQADDDWEEWQLEDITENLRKYVERNPLMSGENIDRSFGNRERSQQRDKMLLGNGQRSRRNFGGCVYCGNGQHKSVDCTTVLSIASRREILKSKKLCYNCTGAGHSASNCYSRCCTKCGQKHHTSICEKQETTVPTQGSEKNMSASSRETRTIHATLMAKVNGQEARILIDTGASSSYVCSDLISKLSLKPARTETRCIEQMYGTVTRQVEIYNVNIKSLVRDGLRTTRGFEQQNNQCLETIQTVIQVQCSQCWVGCYMGGLVLIRQLQRRVSFSTRVKQSLRDSVR